MKSVFVERELILIARIASRLLGIVCELHFVPTGSRGSWGFTVARYVCVAPPLEPPVVISAGIMVPVSPMKCARPLPTIMEIKVLAAG